MEKERWKASCSFINKLGQFLNNMLIEKFTYFSSNSDKLSFSKKPNELFVQPNTLIQFLFSKIDSFLIGG